MKRRTIFLTAHADFAYAQETIHMGGVDYILQPFNGEDVLRALRKAAARVERQRALHGMDRTPEGIRRRKGNMLDGLARKLALGSDAALEQAFAAFAAEERAERGAVELYPMLLEIVNWSKVRHSQGERMLPQFIVNVLEEIFEPAGGGVTVSSLMENRYWILHSARGSDLGPEGFEGGLREFERFVRANMEFRVALYPSGAVSGGEFAAACRGLLQRADANVEKKPGVFPHGAEPREESGDAGIAEQAKAYIARNLSRNISRGDVASEVHLTEEYFSRLFSRQTGYTFKDYLLQEKMRVARKLLESSALSVSIIASKVGYDNFSHFSQIFKKVVGETPGGLLAVGAGLRAGADRQHRGAQDRQGQRIVLRRGGFANGNKKYRRADRPEYRIDTAVRDRPGPVPAAAVLVADP